MPIREGWDYNVVFAPVIIILLVFAGAILYGLYKLLKILYEYLERERFKRRWRGTIKVDGD